MYSRRSKLWLGRMAEGLRVEMGLIRQNEAQDKDIPQPRHVRTGHSRSKRQSRASNSILLLSAGSCSRAKQRDSCSDSHPENMSNPSRITRGLATPWHEPGPRPYCGNAVTICCEYSARSHPRPLTHQKEKAPPYLQSLFGGPAIGALSIDTTERRPCQLSLDTMPNGLSNTSRTNGHRYATLQRVADGRS